MITQEAFSGAQYSLKQVLLKKKKLGSTEKHGLERDKKILISACFRRNWDLKQTKNLETTGPAESWTE